MNYALLASIFEVSHPSASTSSASSSASSSDSAVTTVHWIRVIVNSAMRLNLACIAAKALVA